MPFNSQSVKSLLKKGEIKKLFIEELGWDGGKTSKECKIGSNSYQLNEIAQKAGFKVWLCGLTSSKLPQREEIKLVHRQLVKESYEHIIIFLSNDAKSQSWLWVRRDANKPISYKHHIVTVGQDGESLIQKLRELFIAFEDEEKGITISDVTSKAKKAFDVEKVTKKFYQEFDKHRDIFLGFIEGIPVDSDREWYSSVMLNRLMFAYFIQKKGFLDSNPDYLKSKLKECKQKKGEDKFYSFYRLFLLRLFHEGLGTKKINRVKGLESLLGNIPYLNGGMFDVHELELPERYGKTIEIKDEAFEKIFSYFDQYQWHLDERPLKNDNEINPDVLGYIFEKYINQKQMGAYYTKEDITEYISKNTIIPFILDSTKAKYSAPFDTPDSQVWGLLKRNPDEYIFKSIRHGVDLELPAEIALGIDTSKPNLIKRRAGWNKPAPVDFALPTETWREVVLRRERYAELKKKLSAGGVHSVDQLITLNLDIRQFALEVIDNCEDADLLWAFWQSIYKITVLDPTGGSGAFLFSALNILEPLYEGCLERMEFLLHGSLAKGRLRDFQDILAKSKSHYNRKYFILKSIILNNLYAVDIMEEAVEICKLRLFLKLAAQVEPDAACENLGIEPLPDIDFNICAGNSLVGYGTYDEVQRAVTSTLDFDNTMEKIAVKAADLQKTFDKFRQLQTECDGSVSSADKLQLQYKLNELEDVLNHNLASEYGVKVNDRVAYAKWLKSHQPFHWFIQFYGILEDGGFDVIIGNPPYVEYSKKDKTTKQSIKDKYQIRDYKTNSTNNLYAFTIERTLLLQSQRSWSGMIVPVSFVSGESYSPLVGLACTKEMWLSSFSNRPAKLFDGVEQRLTIYIRRNTGSILHSSSYSHWYSDERSHLFSGLAYTETLRFGPSLLPLKLGCTLERSIIDKIISHKTNVTPLKGRGDYGVWFHDGPTYWIRALPFEPNMGIKSARSNHYHRISTSSREAALIICALLNSSTFYLFFKAVSNCRDFGGKELYLFAIPDALLSIPKEFVFLANRLGESLKATAHRTSRRYDSGEVSYEEYYPQKSKIILDEIDVLLATYYGFTNEELDFIINYDIKYRMGAVDADEEGST